MFKIMPKTIEVLKDEEITSVIDRIISANENNLILIIPVKCRAFKSLIDFQLLKRETDVLGKNVSIASFDPLITTLAKKVGYETRGRVSLNKPIAKVYDIIPPGDMPSISIEDLFEGGGELEENEEEVEYAEKEKVDDYNLDVLPESQQDDSEEENSSNLKPSIFRQVEPKDILPAEDEYASEQFWRDQKYRNGVESEESSERVKKDNIFYNFFKGKKKEPVEIPLRKKSRKFLFSFLSFLIIGVIAAYLIVFYGVSITITPLIAPLNLDFNVLAGIKTPAVSGSKNEIPSQMVKIESNFSQKFDSTGEKDVESKSRGMIFIYNAHSSNKQFLKIETRFKSSEGKIFKTIKNITVPGAKVEDGKIIPSKIEAEVIAEQAGSEYNIGGGKFTIPGFEGTAKFDSFYGESIKPMSGGAKGRVKVVTQSDIDKAKSEMEKKLFDSLKIEITAKKPKDLEFIESAYKGEITQSLADPGLDQIGDTFQYKISGTGKALFFDKSDLNALVLMNLDKEIKTGEIIINSSKKLNYSVNKINFDDGLMELKVSFTSNFFKEISEDELKNQLVSKTEEDVRQILLEDKRIESAQVKFWPFWLKSTPANLSRIKLLVVKPN